MLVIPNSLKEYFRNGSPQRLYIIFPNIIDQTNTAQENAPLIITHEEIKLGSFLVDNKCTAGTWFTPGDAVASECSFSILNTNGRFDCYDFSGQKFIVVLASKNDDVKGYKYFRTAEEGKALIADMQSEFYEPRRLYYIGPSCGTELYDYNLSANFHIEVGDTVMAKCVMLGYHTFYQEELTRIPMGVFYVDTNNQSYGKKEISISGLDDLGQMDIPFPFSAFNYNYERITLSTLAQSLTSQTFYDSINEGKDDEFKFIPYFENTVFTILEEKGVLSLSTVITKQNFTVRQLLSKLAQIGGCIITVTRQGKTRFIPYSVDPQNSLELSPSTRQNFALNSSKIIPFAGTKYTMSNGKTWFIEAQSGNTFQGQTDTGLIFDLTTNDLFMNFTGSTDRRTVMNNINEAYKNETIMPFKGYTLPAPYVDLLDEIVITDSTGNIIYNTRVTHIQHKFNAWSMVETAGQDISASNGNSATPNTSTAGQQAEVKGYIQLRSAVELYSAELAVGETSDVIENLSLYSIFLVTVKRTDGGLINVLCTKGYFNTTVDGEIQTVSGDIRGCYVWRANASTVYEYFLQLTANNDDTLTVNSINSYTTTSSGTVQSNNSFKIAKIYALS